MSFLHTRHYTSTQHPPTHTHTQGLHSYTPHCVPTHQHYILRGSYSITSTKEIGKISSLFPSLPDSHSLLIHDVVTVMSPQFRGSSTSMSISNLTVESLTLASMHKCNCPLHCKKVQTTIEWILHAHHMQKPFVLIIDFYHATCIALYNATPRVMCHTPFYYATHPSILCHTHPYTIPHPLVLRHTHIYCATSPPIHDATPPCTVPQLFFYATPPCTVPHPVVLCHTLTVDPYILAGLLSARTTLLH